MKKRWLSKGVAGYVALLVACYGIATVAGWFATQVDYDAYDWMFRLNPPQASSSRSVVLAIDDATLNSMGGIRGLRTILALALEQLAKAQPRMVATDVILADKQDPAEDLRLERALCATRNLVLATDLAAQSWERPQPRFEKCAVALGHALADMESPDGVTRQIPLEVAADQRRYWALALEAFRLDRGVSRILESPGDLQVGNTIIPASRVRNRPLRVRYVRGGIPQISLKTLLEQPELLERFHDKAVFVGVYSMTAARDRVVTPLADRITGMEVNAQAFETLERGDFFVDASNLAVLAFCSIVAILAGLIFALLQGWLAYVLGAALLAGAHAVPLYLFHHGIVFPYFASLSCAWLSVAGAAVYQHFVVRRQLSRSEDERTRYRQAIHFVTHEMRTPLTAIQGSSEIMGRYALNDDKRKQIAAMIHSESKRLGRMIQTFLDIERLSDGQTELRTEPFEARGLVEACIERVRPLAERKSIEISLDGNLEGTPRGDRELMEYAVYNLLTNAVKYSSSGTAIRVFSRLKDEQLRLSIEDQGMGMDEKELNKVFQRFYRTKRAEASGEQGSGIGLSIVDQIVRHHGGHMEVTSQLGCGSCFTIVVPVPARDRNPSPVSS